MSIIGLWGGPASGKTTYLTSLALSQFLYPESFPWDLRGNDQDSTDWLVQTTKMLSAGEFPVATSVKQTLSFTVSEIDGQERSFTLNIVDRPGGDYLEKTNEIAKELAKCTGLILLLDFKIENGQTPRNDDIEHVRKTTENLKSLLKTAGKLPHSLVVALAKYDDDPLFQWLLQTNMIKVKKHHERVTPYVPNPRKAISQTQNGRSLLSILEREFDKNRIWYAPISSVGFANRPDGSLNRNDHSRIIKAKEASFIKDPENMLPINVWYPFSLLLNSSSNTKKNNIPTNNIPIVDDDNGNFVVDDDGLTFEDEATQ